MAPPWIYRSCLRAQGCRPNCNRRAAVVATRRETVFVAVCARPRDQTSTDRSAALRRVAGIEIQTATSLARCWATRARSVADAQPPLRDTAIRNLPGSTSTKRLRLRPGVRRRAAWWFRRLAGCRDVTATGTDLPRLEARSHKLARRLN